MNNYIDEILTDLNNQISCIWVSGFITIDKLPSELKAREAYDKLISEYTKLHTYQLRDLRKSENDFQFGKSSVTRDESIQQIISSRIEIGTDIPFRLGFLECTDATILFYIQAHHTIGDGRTFTFLIQRYLELLTSNNSTMSLITPETGNVIFLKSLIKSPHSVLMSIFPKFRLSSKRGIALPSLKQTIGEPKVSTAIYRMHKKILSSNECSKIFYAAMIFGIARASKSEGLIRLRIPIDIRPELGLKRAFGNLCPCFSLEIEKASVLKMSFDSLVSEVNRKLRQLYLSKAHHSTHIEGYIFSKLLRRTGHSLHDFHAEKRANTMVVTYMGDMEKITKNQIFNTITVSAHTPTWGCIGFKFNDQLIFNLNSFEGIWDKHHFQAFFEILDEALIEKGIKR